MHSRDTASAHVAATPRPGVADAAIQRGWRGQAVYLDQRRSRGIDKSKCSTSDLPGTAPASRTRTSPTGVHVAVREVGWLACSTDQSVPCAKETDMNFHFARHAYALCALGLALLATVAVATPAAAQTCTSQSSPSAITTECSDGTTTLTTQTPGLTQTLSSDGIVGLSTQSGASTFSNYSDGTTSVTIDGTTTYSGGAAAISTCLGSGLSTSTTPSATSVVGSAPPCS